MIDIIVERQDSNSDDFLLAQWLFEEGATVPKGAVVCLAETQKTVIEVEAPQTGILVRGLAEGLRGSFHKTIGAIASDPGEAARWKDQAATARSAAEVPASRKARHLAERHGLDLSDIPSEGILSEHDVESYLRAKGLLPQPWGHPGDLAKARRRVLVIGAGLGAMQVVDILLNQPDVEVAGCLDDDESLMDIRVLGAPVLGPTGSVGDLWRKGAFDEAIVAVSNDVGIRRRLFEACKVHGIPMANAIDPTARIQRGALLGEGNVLCAHVHVGVGARLGDNNFLSAYSSAEHHTRWGSHISTGPSCVTSALVEVGDQVRMGTGVFLEPGASLGEGSVVASGSIFGGHLPAGHILKTTTRAQMSPLRKDKSR